MEKRNETLAELKAIFPQHSWNTISYIFDDVSEIIGHDHFPFILPSCIERLLELPDGCDSSAENNPSTKTQIETSTKTSNYRNLLNSSTSFPDSMKNSLQDLQAFPNSQVPVYRDKNSCLLSSDMCANNDLSSNNSLVLSTKHDPFVSESDDSSLVSKEIEKLEKEPTKTELCALNNKRYIATNSNETSLIISSSAYLAGSSSRKRNLKISEKTSDIIQHTAQKNNFAEPRSSSKKKVKIDENPLQKRLTCISPSWKEGIADLDSNTSISFCSKTVSHDSELSESSNKKLKFDTPKSMGSFTVTKHNQTPRKSLVTSTHIPKPSPSSISNTVNTDLFSSTCKPVMVTKSSVKSIEHDIINKVSCNLSDQINSNLLQKGMNGFVDSVLKQRSCIFPDVDQEYLKQKIDEQPENMSLSEAVNSSRVATILLDSKQYPKPNATKPLPLKSKQTLKYLESPTYSKQDVKVLRNEFPQISSSVIKRLLLSQGCDYKKTHTLLEGAFKKIRVEGKKAISSLHETYEDKAVNSEFTIQQHIPYDSHGFHSSSTQSGVHKEVIKSDLKTNVSPDDSCLEKVDHSKYNDSDDTHVSKRLKTVQSVDEKEIKIIQKVLKNNNAGFFKLTKYFITTMLKRNFSTGVKWFEKHRDVFRLRTDRLSVKYLHLCIDEIKPCQKYWESKCATSECDMFHICKEYMIDSIHNKRRCHLNHDFKDSHNARVVSKLLFTFLTEDNLMLLLKTRYPFVCVDYQSDSCLDGEGYCSKLHVCSDYLSGNCKKKETLCKNKHDSAFLGNQASRIMEEYHLNAEEFKSCIILPKVTKNDTPYKSDKETFDCWREEAICYKFITAGCDDDVLCHLLHPKSKLPYLWQYKKGYEDTDEVWTSFPIDMNKEMEKQFCDPVQDSWTGIKKINSVSFESFGDYSNNVYDDAQGHVMLRRLSTKSSALTTEQHIGLTDWIWYWSEGNSKWAEYILGTSSKDIEIAYHKGADYRFKTDEFDYSISFNQMTQKNNDPRYLTVRDIKRRPMFKSKEHIKAGLKVSTCVPSHWPQYYSVGEHIVVKYSTYDKIKSEFESSIGCQVTVLDIKEICNEEQYENYQRKKQRFNQKSQQANEKFLYHGTEHSVIKSICTGNFEWRLCGKNATFYGRGSYFATTASYSHKYTTKDDSNRRYMFLASVLTGKSTLGTSTMLIPPLLPASEHERYDSCVDITSCPSMYVIFHKDQCYPSYLVTYKEIAFVNHTDQMMAKDSVDAAIKYEKRLKITAPRSSNSTSTPGRVDISPTTAQSSSLLGKTLATTTSNTNIPARAPSTTSYSQQQSMNYPLQSTNYPSQSTNYASQSTNYPLQSTNYPSQSTNYPSQSPNYASQSPNIPLKSTNYASQSTNYASQSTNYASQ